jgi:hypothetical protein
MRTANITKREYGYGWQVVADLDGARYSATGVAASKQGAVDAIADACGRLGIEVPPLALPPRPGRLEAAFAAVRRGEARRSACLDLGDRPAGAPHVLGVVR